MTIFSKLGRQFLNGSFLLTRRYSTDSKSCHHALLIGSGTAEKIFRVWHGHQDQSLPELAIYRNCKFIEKQLRRQISNMHPTSPRILFGSGYDTHVVKSSDCCQRILIKPFRKLKGDVSRESISREFDDLAQQMSSKDHLWIFFNGHGTVGLGMSLIGKDPPLMPQFLTPRFLSKQLQKLPSNMRVTIIAITCFSGVYQRLSSSKVRVFSSAGLYQSSWYKAGQIDPILGKLFKNLSHSNILASFSSGNIKAGNFFAIDSLSHFLEDKLKANRKWHMMHACMRVAFDWLYSRKFHLLTYVFGCIVFNRDRFNSLYKNWHVLNHQRRIRKFSLDQEPDLLRGLLPQEQRRLQQILQFLKQLKQLRSVDKRLIHYYYLYNNSLLFLHTATASEVREFIDIAEGVMQSP